MNRLLARLPAPAWTVAVQGLDVGAQLIAGLLLARLLGPEALGGFAFALNLAGLLAIFVLFGAQDVCVQLLARGRLAPDRVLNAGALILAGGALFCAVAGGIIALSLGLEGERLAACALALMTLVVNGGASLCNAAIVAAERSRDDVRHLLASRVLLLLGACGGALAGSLVAVLASFLVSALLLFALRVRFVHRELHRLRPRLDFAAAREVWRRGRRIGVGSIFGTISSRSDLLLLEAWTNPAVVGLYGAGYRVLHGVVAGAMAVSLALLPRLSRASAGRGRSRLVAVYWTFPVVLGGALLAMGAFGGEGLLIWLYGDAFEPAREIFRVLLLAGAVQVLLVFGSRWLIARGQEHVLPFSQAAAAATNLSLNVLFIPSLGALGAARATLAAEVVQLCAFIVLGALAEQRQQRRAVALEAA
jgi:O-antigen/teichoic acid export membrane protein